MGSSCIVDSSCPHQVISPEARCLASSPRARLQPDKVSIFVPCFCAIPIHNARIVVRRSMHFTQGFVCLVVNQRDAAACPMKVWSRNHKIDKLVSLGTLLP